MLPLRTGSAMTGSARFGIESLCARSRCPDPPEARGPGPAPGGAARPPVIAARGNRDEDDDCDD